MSDNVFKGLFGAARSMSPTLGRNNIVLDLDNTLLSAEAIEDLNFDDPNLNVKVDEMISRDCGIYNMDDLYLVFERPHLQDFLDYLFSKYNVSVWTAASKDYALFVIDRILLKNPNRKLYYFLFSHHCEISQKHKKSPKNLELLWDKFMLPGFSKLNTVIIDDLDLVYKAQPDNCINIKEFNILDTGSEQDDELIKIREQV